MLAALFEQIEKAATEREATMIVAGTTGKSPLKEIFLGSVATKLTKHSIASESAGSCEGQSLRINQIHLSGGGV